MLTPVSMELRTPPLQLKTPRAVATTVWPSSSSSSSRVLGGGEEQRRDQRRLLEAALEQEGGAVPDGDGLRERAHVVVLVFGPVVQRASEGVQAAVLVQGLGGQLRLPQEVALERRLVRQQVVVELGALELALEGPRRAGVRLGDVAVVAGGGRRRFGGGCVGAVDRGLVGETPQRKVAACRGLVSSQLSFGIGGAQRLRDRVGWKQAESSPLRVSFHS